jgi:glyoxylate reductase
MTAAPALSVVFVTRHIAPAALARLRAAAVVRLWEEDRPIPREHLLAAVAEADGLFALLTERVDEALLLAAPRLRVVSNMAVGYDNIDVPACTRRGIPVGHTPGVLTEASADLAFGLLLAAARRIAEGERYVRAGRWHTWSPSLLVGRDVHGATLGIVGFGRIGQAVARRAAGFGMRLLASGGDAAAAAQMGVTMLPLPELLSASDFVSVHVPLKPATHHLIGAAELAAMPPHAILINTARGAVVDSAALLAALQAGTIGGAALDVTDPEPLPGDHPLLALENCLIVPHIASASVATREQMALRAADNLLAGLAGQPLPFCVNPEVYA